MFAVRHAHKDDLNKIFSLYKKVAGEEPGIARSEDEITTSYIGAFMQNAAETGLELVIENPGNPNQLIAEIHCYKLAPRTFRHVLSELTIVVDPDFHGRGIGKQIFTYLLELITNGMPDILRVELIAQESNTRAIALYNKLGFREEGRFEKRIWMGKDDFEADIPMAWFNKNYKE